MVEIPPVPGVDQISQISIFPNDTGPCKVCRNRFQDGLVDEGDGGLDDSRQVRTMKMKWASIRARRTAALAATAIAVTACAVLQPGTAQASTLQPGTAQASTYPTTSFPAYTQPVTITWWTFTANPESEIKAFNKVYPNIH